MSDIYDAVEPNIREIAIEQATIAVYRNWNEERIRQETERRKFNERMERYEMNRILVPNLFSPELRNTQQTRRAEQRLPQAPPLPKFQPAPKPMSSSLPVVPRSEGQMPVPVVKPRLIRYEAKSPPAPKTPPDTAVGRRAKSSPVPKTPQDTAVGRRAKTPPVPKTPQETYFRGTKNIQVSPPQQSRKIFRPNVEVMGETSAPSGLHQGNEPIGQGRPITKAVRKQRKKTAMPTQKALLPYNTLKNDPYFVK